MSKKEHSPIIIIGGGISGLSLAWYLHKAGIPFNLIEKEPVSGGTIQSVVHKHSVFDFGPNSIRDKDGSVRELVQDLDLSDELITISEAFKTRFIVRDGNLVKLEPSPLSLISSNILSTKGKWRLAREMFAKPSSSDQDECVASFLERRIGQEAVDYLIDPFFSGIYAGNIYKLSKKTLLAKFADFEQEHGSITGGMIKSKKAPKPDIRPKVLSFKNGVQALTNTIQRQLSDRIIHDRVERIQKTEDGFEVQTSSQILKADKVISCIPSYELAEVIDFGDSLKPALRDIHYPPMLSLQVVYKKEDVKMNENGFGFLVPRRENIRLLGAIWKSNIFPENTNSEYLHFNLMAGGSHDEAILSDNRQEVEKHISAEFSKLMDIQSQPIFTKSKLWEKAIPQFEVGYEETKEGFKAFENEHTGFYVGGNYAWGISVPDCIEKGKQLAERIALIHNRSW